MKKANKINKFTVFHNGDHSVGIPSESVEITCDYEFLDQDQIDYFKEEIERVFTDIFDFKAYCVTDSELKDIDD